MDIKTFVQVISKLPPQIAVLAKGPTGIGKSHIVHQVGERLDMQVIDRRLSQMTEGDIIGLPELVDGVTRFAPIDWFVRACNEPVILFFDELNRATIEVQQCAFQIVLDRELNGHKLHPETRVYAAVNEGSEYQVTEMDPALLRRFFVTTLEPTAQDWLDWARKSFDGIAIGLAKTVLTAADRLYKMGYKEVTFLEGEPKLLKILQDYNGVEKPLHNYNFDKISYMQLARDPEASGATGMSASKLRQTVMDNDLEAFKQGVTKAAQPHAECGRSSAKTPARCRSYPSRSIPAP